MNILTHRFFRSVIAGLFCFFAISTNAQQNNSLYYMYGLPQSSQLNPATQPKCGFYFGIPAVSSIEFNAGNSAVGFNDILKYDPSLDSMVWFLHSKTSQNDFLKNFKKGNSIFADARIDLLSFGFRIQNSYFSFAVTERIESNLNIPYDLVRFGMQLNQQSMALNSPSESFDLSGIGVNALWYREYSLGVSHEFENNLTFGIRAKLLYGIANITSNTSNVAINNTGITSWDLRSVTDLNTSVPNLHVTYKPDGKIDSLDIKDINGSSDARSILMNTQNSGLAFDLGVVAKPYEFLSLSLSVLDLGYINWKSNINNLSQDAAYSFTGISVKLNDSTDVGQNLIDTLKNTFTYQNSKSSYKTTLSPKIYAGALFNLTKGVGFGFLTRLQILEKKLYPQYTFSLNLYPGSVFNFTLSYTIVNHTYDNFGFGLAFRLGLFQYYIMSERVPLYYNKVVKDNYYVPAYAKNINLRMGLNISLGYNRIKKLLKDKPLLDL